MRRTRLNRGLTMGAGVLLLAGVLGGTVTPAAAGFAILLYLLHARFAAAAAFDATVLRPQRHVPDAMPQEGRAFRVVLDLGRSRLAHGVQVVTTDEVPASLEAEVPARVHGTGAHAYAVRPSRRGEHAFEAVRARFTDARGLWWTERRVPCATRVHVLPGADVVAAARAHAARRPVDAMSLSVAGHLVRELETEGVREYAHGDRLRDVDWKRVARFERLLTKTWEKHRESTVLVLVDTGRSMRVTGEGATTKLDHAVTLAVGFAEAAAAAHARVGFAAFDESHVVDTMPPDEGRRMTRTLLKRLAALPDRIPGTRRPDVGTFEDAMDADERAFSEAVGLVRGDVAQAGASPRPGVEQALAQALREAGDDRVLLVAFTDVETLPEPTLRALARAAERSDRAFVVLLAGTRFFAPPDVPVARDLESAYREAETRTRARGLLARHGARVLEMGPEDTIAPLLDAGAREVRVQGRPR